MQKVTKEDWLKEFNCDNIKLSDKLYDIIPELNTELKCVLDTLAPVKKCKVNLRPKQPWYDSDIKAHKRQVRKLEVA